MSTIFLKEKRIKESLVFAAVARDVFVVLCRFSRQRKKKI